MDKREHTRNSVTISVELTDGINAVSTFTARDFSPTGAFLEKNEADTPLPAIDSKVHLKIMWPLETHILPVEVEADVRRVADDGVGVSFVIK